MRVCSGCLGTLASAATSHQSPVTSHQSPTAYLRQLLQLHHSCASDNWQRSFVPRPTLRAPSMDHGPWTSPRIQSLRHERVHVPIPDRFRNSHPSSYFRARVSASEAQRPKHLCARVCASGLALLPVPLVALKQVYKLAGYIYIMRTGGFSGLYRPSHSPCPPSVACKIANQPQLPNLSLTRRQTVTCVSSVTSTSSLSLQHENNLGARPRCLKVTESTTATSTTQEAIGALRFCPGSSEASATWVPQSPSTTAYYLPTHASLTSLLPDAGGTSFRQECRYGTRERWLGTKLVLVLQTKGERGDSYPKYQISSLMPCLHMTTGRPPL